MPLVTITITPGSTPAQRAELIEGATALIARVLNKAPAATWVIIDEVETENWGVGGESIAAKNAKAKSG